MRHKIVTSTARKADPQAQKVVIESSRSRSRRLSTHRKCDRGESSRRPDTGFLPFEGRHMSSRLVRALAQTISEAGWP
jgi:hypothetical protein